MSIELKKAAQDLLQALTLCRMDARLMHADDAQRLLMAGQALRTAIQQAEAQQPATTEPLADHSDHVAEIAARLRLVAKLAGCPDAVPDEDGRAVGCIFSVLGNMRRALEKKLATGEQVVSRNPFASRCYTLNESHLSGHRLIVGFEKLGDAQDAHEWVARQGRGDFTHPAPSVPADVVRDAERYRFIRDADVSDDLIPDIALYAMESLDEYIDAAMLAAKEASA